MQHSCVAKLYSFSHAMRDPLHAAKRTLPEGHGRGPSQRPTQVPLQEGLCGVAACL